MSGDVVASASLPSRWRTAHLAYLARTAITNGLGEAAAEGDLSWPRYLRTTDIESLHRLDAAKRVTLPPEVARTAMVEPGDLLMTAAGSLGTSYLVSHDDEPACYAGYLVRFQPNTRKVDPGYIAWWTQSRHHLTQVELGAVRSTIENFSAGKFRSMSAPLPPLDEQRAIAEYLDEQTAKIDTLIAKQTEMIRLLAERRDARRDAHFQSDKGKRRMPLRRALKPVVRPAIETAGVITAFRDGQVTLRSNRREDGYTFSETESGYQAIHPGDLVFHALDGFAGAVGISDSTGNGSPVYHVCEPVGEVDGEYIALLLRYLGTSGFLATQAPNVRQRSVDFRNWSMFGRVPLALPTLAEQREFVAIVKAQTTKIDRLIAKTREHMTLAKERRSALITAAVTGQFDVRTASTSGVA